MPYDFTSNPPHVPEEVPESDGTGRGCLFTQLPDGALPDPTDAPACCPICGETKVRYNTGKLVGFSCGCIIGIDGLDPDECSNAVRSAITLHTENAELRATVAALTARAENDYADMRKFQAKFIEADHELRDLRVKLDSTRAWAALWKQAAKKRRKVFNLIYRVMSEQSPSAHFSDFANALLDEMKKESETK